MRNPNTRASVKPRPVHYVGGEHLDAHRAKEIGLVNDVVDHDELLSVADGWCSKIASLPEHAIAMTKPLLRAAADSSWDQSLTLEEFAEPHCFSTQAFQENVKALDQCPMSADTHAG